MVLTREQGTSITPSALGQSTAPLESPPIPQEEIEETMRNNCSPQGKPDHDRHLGTVTALLLPPVVSQGWEWGGGEVERGGEELITSSVPCKLNISYPLCPPAIIEGRKSVSMMN